MKRAFLVATACLWAGVGLADPFADAMLAYRDGHPGEAAALFRDLADQGDAEAQFNLALLYQAGEGMPQNDRQALYWAWRARLSGLPQAELLTRVLRGGVTAEDTLADIAHRLMTDLQPRLAAGDGLAMLGAARVLTELDPAADVEAAYVWESMAAALGTPGAATARDATFASQPPESHAQLQDKALAAFRDWCGKAGAMAAACRVID